MVPLLLIGTASDGPSEITTPRSLREAEELYGGVSWQAFTPTATSTGVTLATAAWGDQVEVLHRVRGIYQPYYLHDLAVSGTAVTFQAPGHYAAGATTSGVVYEDLPELTLRYRPIPGPNNLVRGYEEARLVGDFEIGCLRVGGTAATGTLELSTGTLYARARYRGARYNAVTLTATGNELWITPPPGEGDPQIFQGDTLDDLIEAVNLAASYQRCPVTLAAASSAGAFHETPAVTGGLSGGEDGTLTAALIEEVLASDQVERAGVICFLGLREADLPASLAASGLEDLESDRPVLLVCGAAACTGSVSGWVESILAGASPAHKLLLVAAGEGTFHRGLATEYEGSLATCFAAAVASRFSPTLAPLPVPTFTPRLDTDQLGRLFNAGYNVPLHTLSQGPAWWTATTRDPTWSLRCVRVYQTICQTLREGLEPYLGSPGLSVEQLDTRVAALLSDLPGIAEIHAETEVSGDALFVNVFARAQGEIRTIQFRINLLAPRGV